MENKQQKKYSTREKLEHEDSEMNAGRAFKILECNTLAKKWNYKSQYKKLSLLTHPDKNPSTQAGAFQEVSNANHFLDSYCKELRVFSYTTAKIFPIWMLYILLRSFLRRKREKTDNEKISREGLQMAAGNRKILSLITNSFTLFTSELLFLWWILSLQKPPRENF